MTRFLLVALWIVAAIASALVYADDARSRRPAEAFAGEYSIAGRRPVHADAIRYAPAADLAFEAAADAALADTIAMVNLSELDAPTRQLWIASVSRFDDELRDAGGLLLEAIGTRPGWPTHRGLLGQVEFMRARREMRLQENPRLWLIPLRSAVEASPGKEGVAVFAAGAAMEAWPYLTPETRSELSPLFRTAMKDHRFVRIAYLDLATMIGDDVLRRLLPDSPPSIRAAMTLEAAGSDVPAVGHLHARWERAEWRSRTDDLQKIEERHRLGDEPGLRRLSHAWLQQHGVAEFDTPAGRRQLSRLLELWPAESGAWRRDPRASVVQFLLHGRTADADPQAMQRTIGTLTDVPDVVAARVALMAGDTYGADRIARSSDTAGAFEWTRYYVDLARHHLAERRPTEARAALAEISAAAREECDVAVVRRMIEQDPLPIGEPAYWSRLSVPLCIEPAARTLEVEFEAPAAAVVNYGFNGGRSGTVIVPPGRTKLAIPLTQQGRHIFSLQKVAGADIRPISAEIR